MILIPLHVAITATEEGDNLVKHRICVCLSMFCLNDTIFVWYKREKKNLCLSPYQKLTLNRESTLKDQCDI